MKRFLFIYLKNYESFGHPDFEMMDRPELEDHEFPAHTTDWEVLLAARRGEIKDLRQDFNTASEGILNLTLLRVVQIAREVPLDLPWEE